ncbi:MAG: hypothetical protein ACK4SO_06570, partial [Candidatus Kapaibacteriota bacterium]
MFFYVIASILLLFDSSLAQPIEESQLEPLKSSKTQLVKIPVGTEFWICFMKNYQESDPKRPAGELFLEL